MSNADNKTKVIRCELVHDVFSAKATRGHNDTNVLKMGERVVGARHTREIVSAWLDTSFEGGRHAVRVEKLMMLED